MDLGEGIRKAISRLTGATVIDAKVIREFNKELQKALISSDVEVALVSSFTKRIEDAALKENIPPGVTPRDYITNMVYSELVRMMGDSYTPEIKPKRILLLGLYGSGKTTTAAKLAKFYQDRGLSVGLIACDVTRPAAYEQLEILSKQANVSFYGIKEETDIGKIIRNGIASLKDRKVLICDSGGRSAFDKELVDQLKVINDEFQPTEKLLVINADTGQVAGRQAKEFDGAVKITGVIITKLDGSGRGGGALSAVNASNVKATFVGTGEKLNALDLYDSKKFVGKLLGIPDIESLIKSVNDAVKEANIKPEEINMENLDFQTFYTQLKAMSKMGPIKNVLGMMGMNDVPKNVAEESQEKLKKYESIIASMTPAERSSENLVREHSRVSRIARGSGTSEKDVKGLISDFNRMKKFYSMFKNDRSFNKKMSKFMGSGGSL